MPRIPEQGRRAARFDYLTGVHHRDTVGEFLYDAHIVRYQKHGTVSFFPDLLQQFEDLCLHGDIECGRWFVGNDEVWVIRECGGDHHALQTVRRTTGGRRS